LILVFIISVACDWIGYGPSVFIHYFVTGLTEDKSKNAPPCEAHFPELGGGMKNRKLLLVLIVVLLFGCQFANGLTGAVPSPAVSQGPTTPRAATVTGWWVALNTKTPTPPPTATIPLPTYMIPNYNLALWMFSDGGGWLLTAFSNNKTGLLHTTDGGLSWSNVLPAEFSDIAVKAYFLDPQHAWIFGNVFFQRTTDGGETWQPLDPNGLGVTDSLNFPGLQFSDANNGWAEHEEVGAGHVDVFIKVTRDGGETWTPVTLLAPSDSEQAFTSGLHLAAICNDFFYYSNQRQIILYGSTSSCQTVVSGYTGGPRNAFPIDLSTDLGRTWNEIAIPFPANSYLNTGISAWMPVFFNDQDGILPFQMSDLDSQDSAYDFSDLAIYHTYDGGRHWQPNQVVLQHVSKGSLQVLSSQIFIVKCDGGFCITKDSAHTWQTIPFGQDNPGSYSFISPTVGLALAQEQIPGTDLNHIILWRTMDGGGTWTQVPVSAPSP
jgi:photosystem II stability/assembly factor-like uncharacterized protein